MITRIFCLIFLCGLQLQAFAQTQKNSEIPITTLYPVIESQGEKSVRVQKIEITNTQTIISFVHTNLSQGEMWIQIMPSIKIIGAFGKRTFKFIKA